MEPLDEFDHMDVDSTIELEYHDRLVEASKWFKTEDEFRELLRLRFKLVAKGVVKAQRSLDDLQIPTAILDKVRDLFDCLDWALSADE